MMSTSVFSLIFLLLIYLITDIYSSDTCGIENSLKRDRIVNGRELNFPRKYPWYTALVLASNGRQLACGASLIHERHVLTAAHCFKSYFESVKKGKIRLEDIYFIKLGIHNICIYEHEVETMSALKVHIHEEYYNNLLFFDIALMVLDTRVTNYMPICLPLARYESNNRTNFIGTIIGLGKESSTAWKTPCTVKEAEVPIQPDSTCDNMLKSSTNKNRPNDIFCAGYPEGQVDTCQGDSGGPVQVYRESTSSWMILGITSFGFGCAQPEYYGVYTDVSHYLDWIHDKINYSINQNYVFNTTDDSASSSDVAKHDPIPIFHKRKNKGRAFQKWILNMLDD